LGVPVAAAECVFGFKGMGEACAGAPLCPPELPVPGSAPVRPV